MNWLLFMIGGIVVLGVLNDVLDTIIKKLLKREPPKSIKIAEKSEMIFGSMVLLSSIYFVFIEKNSILTYFALVIGFLWLFIATALYLGKNWARVACLILSILRIPTIIGIVFSIISIYLLFFTEQSKSFFKKESHNLS
ncbi:hypothetical protein ACFL1G_02905 [Planctomycetota bacterium]